MRGSMERAVIAAAVSYVSEHPEANERLTAVVRAHLEDDARPNRPLRDSCGVYSTTGTMRCKRPRGHLLDSDRPHSGFDRAGRMRSWA